MEISTFLALGQAANLAYEHQHKLKASIMRLAGQDCVSVSPEQRIINLQAAVEELAQIQDEQETVILNLHKVIARLWIGIFTAIILAATAVFGTIYLVLNR
jgi:hypothetical protein